MKEQIKILEDTLEQAKQARKKALDDLESEKEREIKEQTSLKPFALVFSKAAKALQLSENSLTSGSSLSIL